MEQLIFFAVIIFFSIIESIARSRKRKGGGQVPQLPPEWQWEPEKTQVPDGRTYDAEPTFDAEPAFDAEPSVEERPSFDAEPSFDDVVSTRQPRPGADIEPPQRAQRAPATSSESMIPADLWEEIAGLGRGRAPVPAEAAPRTARPLPTRPARPLPTRPARPAPVPEVHVVHQAHVGFGTDPSERARSEQDGLDPLAGRLSADASAVRKQLRTGGRHALRQAVILQEVLGPPVSTRPDRYQE
jgi:hypothetical protein